MLLTVLVLFLSIQSFAFSDESYSLTNNDANLSFDKSESYSSLSTSENNKMPASYNSSYSSADTIAPQIPNNFRAYSYELHGDLYWDLSADEDIKSYVLYKWNGSIFAFYELLNNTINFKMVWLGSIGKSEKFKIQALDNSGNASQLSKAVEIVTHEMTDDEFMDMVQRATFRYFWNWGDPISGVARERWRPDESDKTNTIGGGGFGVMGILVGIDRNFIKRTQGAERILKIADFLENKLEKFNGAFPHWFNGTTGKVVNFGEQNGGDIVETAFMIEGLLCARQYFDGQDSTENKIRELVTKLWENVDWDFYRNNSTGLYWNWSPTMGFNFNETFIFHGWNETLMAYLLALASPSHPIGTQYYTSGWGNNGNIKFSGSPKYGISLSVGNGYGGPLFFTHYSFIAFDPRVKRDLYANYFGQNINQSLINYNYCIENPKNFVGYSENCWGLTASTSIPGVGYMAHEPMNNDNGTISPTAALSSMPYTPHASTQAMKYFYRTFKDNLWGNYGFKDAFNQTYSSVGVNGEWFSDGYLAIDQGPIICMIENYRSQLLWNLFMNDPDIKILFDKYPPFFDSNTPSDIKESEELPSEIYLNQNYPNPFNPLTVIEYSVPNNTLKNNSKVEMFVYDLLGQELVKLVDDYKNPGNYQVFFNGSQFPSGVYYYSLSIEGATKIKKMILLK